MKSQSPLIKICGITRLDDAREAVELGVDLLGFVCWPDSPRYIEPPRIREILRSLPRPVAAVGVFVNQDGREIRTIAELAPFSLVQLHGDEPQDSWSAAGIPVIKAVGVGRRFDLRALDDWPPSVTPLLDAHDPVHRGGTGKVIDWTVAKRVARSRPIVLSGGLNPGNVADAIAIVRPWAVDVSSGVEVGPGVKDVRLMRAFVEAVRGRAAESGSVT
jgi:phosphoribosylanthranilate isomerase